MHGVGQLPQGGAVALVHAPARCLLAQDHGYVRVQRVGELEQRTHRQLSAVLLGFLHQGEGNPRGIRESLLCQIGAP